MPNYSKGMTLRFIVFANILAFAPMVAVAAGNGMNNGSAPQGSQQQSSGHFMQSHNSQSSNGNKLQPPSHALVKKVQRSLNQQQGSNIKVDGMFGRSTIDSLKHYQRSHGLKATGVIDNRTKKSLLHM